MKLLSLLTAISLMLLGCNKNKVGKNDVVLVYKGFAVTTISDPSDPDRNYFTEDTVAAELTVRYTKDSMYFNQPFNPDINIHITPLSIKFGSSVVYYSDQSRNLSMCLFDNDSVYAKYTMSYLMIGFRRYEFFGNRKY